MISAVKSCLKEHLSSDVGQLVVAFSGGVDSTVLLHVIAQIKSSLTQKYPQIQWCALHVNHGISNDADEWQQHCLEQAESQGFTFLTASHIVVAGNRESLEQKARVARYQSFVELTEPNAVILLAQHLDDQAETFLLQLKRGAGVKGLASMGKATRKNRRIFLRPLLDTSRAEIEVYANQHKLVWIEDDSNQDEHIDRNFLRKNLLPQFEQRWTGFTKAVARSAAHCAEQNALLEELAEQDLKRSIGEDQQIGISKLRQLSEVRVNNLLRLWITQAGFKLPSTAILEQVRSAVINAKPDASPVVGWGSGAQQCEVRRHQGQLYLLPMQKSLVDEQLIWQNVNKAITLPDDLGELHFSDFVGVRMPNEDETVSIRFKADTQPIRFSHRARSITVSKLMKELKIAPWLRTRTPMIFYNQQLVAIAGIAVVAAFEAVVKE